MKKLEDIDPALPKAINWLNKNKEKIFEKYPDGQFDYPDYFGMPESISKKLMGDSVDFLQAQIAEWYL